MPAAAALAAHLKQGVPQAQFGGLLGVFASHAVQVRSMGVLCVQYGYIFFGKT